MLIVMHQQATEQDIQQVLQRMEGLGFKTHPMPGPTRTAIGITGNTAAIDPRHVIGLPGVRDAIRVTKPYKLASREMKADDSVVKVPQTHFDAKGFTLIAGPCSAENEKMIMQTAEFLADRGIRLMRAGAYKPRTSPYSFQGLGQQGLDLLSKAREQFGVGIVTEVMEVETVAAVEEAADILQIGTRNMQNFPLLKRVGECRKPALLKRGMSATLDEWLMAAEYLLAGGNRDVIMCERGVRTFADHTRNTLDLTVIPPLKEKCHLPVIIDPSHATGRRNYVLPMALAGLAAGADGAIVEIHPQPDEAMSDGAQSLTFDQFDELLDRLKSLAAAVGREIR